MKSRLRTNPDSLTKSVLSQGLTMSQAAQKAGVSVVQFSLYIKSPAPVHYRTASRLIKAFGTDTIKILPPAQM